MYPRVDVIIAGQQAPEPAKTPEPVEVPNDEPKPKPAVRKK
ncbi:hypothetical protein QWJ90_01315 [Microbacterium oryzae]|nr:hypothetical protein [Microbacterium oryzae]MDN3309561.1 hypothetical protein [Microbacterium oryzae]